MSELSVPADRVRADGEAFLITMPPLWLDDQHNAEPGPSPELVALNQPCPSNDCDHGRLWDDPEMPHPDCGGSGCDGGAISHRVWLDPEWGILPIRDGEAFDYIDIGSSYDGPFPVVTFDPHDNALIVYDSDPDVYHAKPIVLPPAARPGDYVARAVKVVT